MSTVVNTLAGIFKHPGNGSLFVPHPYYSHYDYAKSEWTAVTALLFLWGLTLVAHQIAVWYEARARIDMDEGERTPLVGDPEEAAKKAAEWAPRLSKAADALRHSLLMLLGATIFLTLPLPYTCKTPASFEPGLPMPIPGKCMTCLSNGTTLGTSILAWVFFALTILWVILELAAIDPISSAVVRAVIGATAFPLILAMFVVGFKEWEKIRSRDARDCP